MRLDGKVALITGGARGQGAAEARLFAREGAKVVIADVLDPDGMAVAAEINELGGDATYVHLDVSSEDDWQQAIGAAVSAYGKLDVLVNNAAIWRGGHVADTSSEQWDIVLDINAKGVFLGTKLAIPEMRKAGAGSIINISSTAGLVGSRTSSAYSASKFAVLGLTQASALDLAPYGITVNAVCPGPINTDRMSYWERDQAAERGITQEEFRSRIVQAGAQASPLGRIAEPQDVASVVAFLASEEASFVTGQAYNVNGGLLFH